MEHQFFKNSYFPSTIIEWNKAYCKQYFWFPWPYTGKVTTHLTTTWTKSPSWRQIQNSFQSNLNSLCSCRKEVKTTSHFLLSCPNYSHERSTLRNKIRTWAHQGVQNVSFLENFAYLLHGLPLYIFIFRVYHFLMLLPLNLAPQILMNSRMYLPFPKTGYLKKYCSKRCTWNLQYLYF